MRNSKLFSIEIDVSDYITDNYGRWANYGTIVSEGDNLDDLLDMATVDVHDQDGGELDVVSADASWMQDLIEQEYYRLVLPRGVTG